MDKVKVIYGSTTGNTESAAQQIASAFGVKAINIPAATADDFTSAELLILGSSTWGYGELQDDWESGIAILEGLNLSGKKIAVFGMGDQTGFCDTYCDAIAIIAKKAQEQGATLVGQTSAANYHHSSSLADVNGTFCGLALDDNNEPEKTSDRITAWVAELKTI